jgi:hypothetical protein
MDSGRCFLACALRNGSSILASIVCWLPVVGCVLSCATLRAQSELGNPYARAEVIPPAPLVTPLVQGPIVEPLFASPGLDTPVPGSAMVDGISWLPPWTNPTVWFSSALWNGSYELGLNGAGGNADAFSLQTGFELSRETDRTNWDIDFAYAKNQANGAETQNNALFWSNWDYKLASPRYSWFSKLLLEYDEFKDFDLRLAFSTGLGYLLVDTPVTQWRGRFGASTSREIDSVDNAWKPEATFGVDLTHQLSPRQKLSMTVDYYPTWDDFSDYRVVTDAGWEFLLDKATNLSLKLGLIDRYDSTPGGSRPNDVNYSLLLLWKI